MLNKKVSIVIPVFNAKNTIRNCLDSIDSDVKSLCEIIVVDGFSTDGTKTIVVEFIKNGIIDKFVSEKDSGIYDAVNKGCALASGDWLYVLGSDDALIADQFVSAVNELQIQSFIYYANVKHKFSGKIYWGRFNKAKCVFYNISHQAIFYPINYVRTTSYKLKYKICSDYDYLFRAMGAGFDLKYLNKTICIYNDREGVSSKNEDIVFLADKAVIIRKAFGIFYSVIYSSFVFLSKVKRRMYN